MALSATLLAVGNNNIALKEFSNLESFVKTFTIRVVRYNISLPYNSSGALKFINLYTRCYKAKLIFIIMHTKVK